MAKKAKKIKAMAEKAADVSYVPFTEFGPALVRTLLSAKMLAFQLGQAIPKSIPIPAGIAHLEVGQLVEVPSGAADSEIDYRVRLAIHINAARGIVQCTATPTLTIRAKTFAPATLFVDVDEVTPDDIQFDNENWDLEPVAALLGGLLVGAIGAILGGLVGGAIGGAAGGVAGVTVVDGGTLSLVIRTVVAQRINEQVADSLNSRIVDLIAMVGEKESDANPPAAVKKDDTLWPVPSAGTVSGVISPGQTCSYGMLLLRGARVRLKAYFQSQQMNQADASMTLFIGPEGGEGMDWIGVGSATGREYVRIDSAAEKKSAYFRAPETGVYRYGVHFDKLTMAGPQEYKIIQQRLTPDFRGIKKPVRISFAEFGANFVNDGINREMLRRALQKEIPATIPQSEGPFHILVKLSVREVHKLTVPHPNQEEDLRAIIDLDLKINCDGVKPTLQIQGTTSLLFRVRTGVNPARLFIDIDPTSKEYVIIPTNGIKTVGGVDIPLLKSILAALTPGVIAAKINEQTKDKGQTIDFDALVNDMIKNAPPPTADVPGEITQIEIKPGRPQKLSGGQAAYYPVALSKGEVLALDVDLWLQQNVAFRHDTAESIAVCDSEFGIIQEESVMLSGNQTKKKKTTIRFKAPEDGIYYYRVRNNPFAEDVDTSVLNFQITPTQPARSALGRVIPAGDVAPAAPPKRRRKDDDDFGVESIQQRRPQKLVAPKAIEEVQEVEHTEEVEEEELPVDAAEREEEAEDVETAEAEEEAPDYSADYDGYQMPPHFEDPDQRLLPEPLDPERRWLFFEGDREVYVVRSSKAPSVFHFVQDCPALKSARRRPEVATVDGLSAVDEVVAALELDVCGTCCEIDAAAENREYEMRQKTRDPYQCIYFYADGDHRMEVYCNRVDYLSRSTFWTKGSIVSIHRDEILGVESHGNVLTATVLSPSLEVIGEQFRFQMKFDSLEERDEALTWLAAMRGEE